MLPECKRLPGSQKGLIFDRESSAEVNSRTIRILLWILVALAAAGAAALLLIPRKPLVSPPATTTVGSASFGGPFTLLDGAGKAFSSQALAGKPNAIYFGFTRCGDVCPTPLARLVKLRRQVASDQALRIVFVTVDPANDGPKEVGQYAGLFNAPITGLTGTQARIDQVKKQYGIFAQPMPARGRGRGNGPYRDGPAVRSSREVRRDDRAR